MEELNEECRDIAYVLGREFSVLEAIQEEASNELSTLPSRIDILIPPVQHRR